MESCIVKTTILRLTESEANWLKWKMQSPENVDPDNENPTDKKFREKLYTALDTAQVVGS